MVAIIPDVAFGCHDVHVLRKIDCVMVWVPDLDEAVAFYCRAFGLTPHWRDDVSAGLNLPETDAEIVLHTMDLPPDCAVNYLVDDVLIAVVAYERAGGTVREPPFDIAVGKCAVLEDPYGNAICILDLTNGPRPSP
jgi:predicted enzyme related to lactoylglutathione lyase